VRLSRSEVGRFSVVSKLVFFDYCLSFHSPLDSSYKLSRVYLSNPFDHAPADWQARLFRFGKIVRADSKQPDKNRADEFSRSALRGISVC
jgi:hypothetical protein